MTINMDIGYYNNYIVYSWMTAWSATRIFLREDVTFLKEGVESSVVENRPQLKS